MSLTFAAVTLNCIYRDQLVFALQKDRRPVMFVCDCHGHNGIKDCILYGCDPTLTEAAANDDDAGDDDDDDDDDTESDAAVSTAALTGSTTRFPWQQSVMMACTASSTASPNSASALAGVTSTDDRAASNAPTSASDVQRLSAHLFAALCDVYASSMYSYTCSSWQVQKTKATTARV